MVIDQFGRILDYLRISLTDCCNLRCVCCLNTQTFQRMTNRGDFEKVWAGVMAAERAGLTPIKLNAVIVRGYNDDTVTALAKLTLEYPWQIRLVELMPLGEMAAFSTQHFVSGASGKCLHFSLTSPPLAALVSPSPNGEGGRG